MFKRLFGGREPRADREADQVWVSDAARYRGVVRQIAGAAAAGRSVVVVALRAADAERLAASLAPQRPTRCADMFGRAALDASLARPGAVTIALAAALSGEARAQADVPVSIVVVGRHDRRADDEAIEKFADAVGPRASLTFHMALDDPLIREFGERLPEMLGRLGLNEDEPITSALVTRAIRSAQEKRERGSV
jgi:preprotein translocase subunit SecA